MRSGFVLGAVAVAAGAGACTLFTPFDTDLTSGDALADAAASSDAGDGDGRADTDASEPEGGTEAGGPCVKGARLAPLRVFDPSPTPGFTCSVENVFVEDGKVAGMDRGDTEAPLDGTNVTGCIGIELPDPVDQVTVRAQPTAQGCLTPCSSSNCGTGHDFAFYAGPSEGALSKVTGIALASGDLQDYAVPIPADGLRFFAVCRTAWGDSRDDVAVDVIHGRCR